MHKEILKPMSKMSQTHCILIVQGVNVIISSVIIMRGVVLPCHENIKCVSDSS